MEKGVINFKYNLLLILPLSNSVCMVGYDKNDNYLTSSCFGLDPQRTFSRTEQINLTDIHANDSISYDGSTLTLRFGGTYELLGAFEGNICVDTNENVEIILNNVQIISNSGAGINFLGNGEYTIHSLKGTENYIVDSLDNAEGAAIRSNGNLTITGKGTLIVTGLNDHAIIAKNNINILDTTIDISANETLARCQNVIIYNSEIITNKSKNKTPILAIQNSKILQKPTF